MLINLIKGKKRIGILVVKKKKCWYELYVGVYVCFFFFIVIVFVLYVYGIIEKNYNCNFGIKCLVFFVMVVNVVFVMI